MRFCFWHDLWKCNKGVTRVAKAAALLDPDAPGALALTLLPPRTLSAALARAGVRRGSTLVSDKVLATLYAEVGGVVASWRTGADRSRRGVRERASDANARTSRVRTLVLHRYVKRRTQQREKERERERERERLLIEHGACPTPSSRRSARACPRWSPRRSPPRAPPGPAAEATTRQ